MSHVLESVVVIGLTVPGFVRAVRMLPAVQSRVLAGVKPWACDVCMCFWSTAALASLAGAVFGPEHLFAAGPAYTVALYVLGRLEEPPTAPPPEL